MLEQYKDKKKEAVDRKGEKIVNKIGENSKTIYFPSDGLSRQAKWLALSVIDAFYSWTEHVFIHSAVLKGQATTGDQVRELAEENWDVKFKAALDLTDPKVRKFYDPLVLIKQQIRNYLAHGAFGKKGEAFQIHTGAGAVPLLMPHQKSKSKYSFKGDLAFDEGEALKTIDEFFKYYWDSDNNPETIYIQSGLPSVLTMTLDGQYQNAMKSTEEMQEFVEHLSHLFDRSRNMDW